MNDAAANEADLGEKVQHGAVVLMGIDPENGMPLQAPVHGKGGKAVNAGGGGNPMQDIIRLVIGPGAVLNPGIIGFRPRTMAEHAQNRLHGIRGGSSGRTCQDGGLRDGRSGLGRSGMAGNEVSCPKDSLGRPVETRQCKLNCVKLGFVGSA